MTCFYRLFLMLSALIAPLLAEAESSALAPERNMKRGEIISASDMSPIALDPKRRLPPGGYASDLRKVVGMELQRSLTAGRPFRMSDLREPPAIRKGDPVTLVYISAGLRLTVEGRALADASPGRAVRVMNLYSKRAIDAIVTGSGTAQVPKR